MAFFCCERARPHGFTDHVLEVAEYDELVLDEYPHAIEIRDASYGHPSDATKRKNVRQIVEQKLDFGKCRLRLHHYNELFGDPCPFKVKTLQICYRVDLRQQVLCNNHHGQWTQQSSSNWLPQHAPSSIGNVMDPWVQPKNAGEGFVKASASLVLGVSRAIYRPVETINAEQGVGMAALRGGGALLGGLVGAVYHSVVGVGASLASKENRYRSYNDGSGTIRNATRSAIPSLSEDTWQMGFSGSRRPSGNSNGAHCYNDDSDDVYDYGDDPYDRDSDYAVDPYENDHGFFDRDSDYEVGTFENDHGFSDDYNVDHLGSDNDEPIAGIDYPESWDYKDD